MPVYHPIDIGRTFDCVYSELLDFRWTPDSVVAYFHIPDDDEEVVRVEARGATSTLSVHILDDMVIGEFETSPSEGHVPRHFAYRIVGSALDTSNTEILEQTHYQFVTGGTCLSLFVPARRQVRVEIVKRPDWLPWGKNRTPS
jgi:hypothetical protein